MSFFYPVKVNAALATMGFHPKLVDGAWRSDMQQAGKRAGLTAQETAFCIVGEFFQNRLDVPDAVERSLAIWKQDGKLNINARPIQAALQQLGYATPGLNPSATDRLAAQL